MKVVFSSYIVHVIAGANKTIITLKIIAKSNPLHCEALAAVVFAFVLCV